MSDTLCNAVSLYDKMLKYCITQCTSIISMCFVDVLVSEWVSQGGGCSSTGSRLACCWWLQLPDVAREFLPVNDCLTVFVLPLCNDCLTVFVLPLCMLLFVHICTRVVNPKQWQPYRRLDMWKYSMYTRSTLKVAGMNCKLSYKSFLPKKGCIVPKKWMLEFCPKGSAIV